MSGDLKRDEIVILRIDGEDLLEFINSPSFEPEMVSLYSELDLPKSSSLKEYIIKAFEKLEVHQGMPPTSDSWIMSSIIQPALKSCDDQQQIIYQEAFSAEFYRVAEIVAKNLNEQHVIVAHIDNTFDGSDIKRLLSNKFELEKTLEAVIHNVRKNEQGEMTKEFLHLALDVLASLAGLPPFGKLDEIDKVFTEVLQESDAIEGTFMKEDEIKNLLAEILGNIMLRLEEKPISLSTNTVVHEPLATSL